MKKLFTLVFGVLFAMCANAVTLDIGEPNNNTKDAKANQVIFDLSLIHISSPRD